MKYIYIHIGCGKTGTSALQVWLSQNNKIFYELGYYYPQVGDSIAKDYQITSGNGVEAVKLIKSGDSKAYFSELVSCSKGHILLSSEAFQSLDRGQLLEIKSIFNCLGLKPVIIVYLRDIYDVLNSTYHQLVKRHMCTQTLREFMLSRRGIQQFKVIDTWSSIFDNIKVLHYDVEQSALDMSFLRALNIQNNLVPRMKRKTVNRSLTLYEIELLRFVNSLYVDKFNDINNGFSTTISDFFIKLSPEEKSAILYDPEAETYLINKFSSKIKEINDRYFSDGPGLAVFRPEGKNVTDSALELHPSFKSLLSILFAMNNFVSKTEAKNFLNSTKEFQEVNNLFIVQSLKQAAFEFEASDISRSLVLMKAAQALTPNEHLINKKISEYLECLKASKDRMNDSDCN